MASVEPEGGLGALVGKISVETVAPQPDPEPQGELYQDLEEWDGGLAKRTISFYHAEGAPYLDDDGKLHAAPPPEEMAEFLRQGLAVPPTIVEEIVAEVVPIKHENVIDVIYTEKAPVKVAVRAEKSEKRAPEAALPGAKVDVAVAVDKVGPVARLPGTRVNRMLDLGGIEELAFLALNGVFPGGLTIPVRKEGLANFDVTVKGKEILIDVQGPLADIPTLSVWRITFAFEGEPLLIWGRGVKGDIKVYRLRVVRFMYRAWRAKRARKKIARDQLRDTWAASAHN